MSAFDPKDRVRIIIRSAFQRLPRTRSNRGWYLSQRSLIEFTEDIVRQLFSSSGIAFLDAGFDFEETVTKILTQKNYPSEQQLTEHIIRSISVRSEQDVVKIITDALDTLPRQAWVNRYVPSEERKEQFISKIVDELFNIKGPVVADTIDNILAFLAPLLGRMKGRMLSAQDRAEEIVKKLKGKYTKSGAPLVGLII